MPDTTAPRVVLVLAACLSLLQCSGSSSSPANSIVVRPARVVEGRGEVAVVLSRTNFVAGAVSLRYETVDGTAKAPRDYTAAAGTVTWSADDRADKTVRIAITDDPWIEGVEQFGLRILEVTGGAGAVGALVTIVVDDDDGSASADFAGHRLLLEVPGGSASAAVGDLDGDGTTDLAVGEPTAGGNAGRVRVFSGRTGAVLGTVSGRIAGDFLGTLVAGPGDLNGDGTPDVLAYGFGGTNWLLRGLSGTDGAQLFQVIGDPLDLRPAQVIAGIPDVDSDGTRDFVVGMPTDTAQGPARVGVYSGATGRRIRFLIAPVAGEGFGASVASIADVSGDGVDDLLVGAPTAAGIEPGAGAAYLFSGAGGQPLARVPGPLAGGGFGAAVAGGAAGAFFVGAPGTAADRGAVYRLAGRNPQPTGVVVGTVEGTRLGASLVGAGDLDGDGSHDVLAGVPVAGEVVAFSGAGLLELLRLTGAGGFGAAIEVLGDTNDDGHVDLAVRSAAGLVVLSTSKLPLVADVGSIRADQGGTQRWSLDFGPRFAGQLYWVLGSFGTKPGIDLGLVHLPLNFDPVLDLTIQAANTTLLVDTRGTLDGDGRGLARIVVPPVTLPSAKDETVYFSVLVLGGAPPAATAASNAVPLRLTR